MIYVLLINLTLLRTVRLYGDESAGVSPMNRMTIHVATQNLNENKIPNRIRNLV